MQKVRSLLPIAHSNPGWTTEEGEGGEGRGAAKAAASTTSLAFLHVVVVCMEVFFGRCSHPATHLAPG